MVQSSLNHLNQPKNTIKKTLLFKDNSLSLFNLHYPQQL